MTARGFFAVGVSDLTQVNRRLIAQASAPGVPVEAGNPFVVGEDAGRVEDPDTGEESGRLRGRMSSADPFEFYRIREFLKREVFGGDLDGMSVEVLNGFINAWDAEWRRQQGWAPDEHIDRGATLDELVNMEAFQRGASWLPVTGRGLLPPVFTSETERTLEDGTVETVPVVAVQNPLTGVEFTEVTVEVASDPSRWATAVGSAWRKIINSDPFSPISTELIKGAREAEIDISGGSRGSIGLVAPGAMDPNDWQLHVARFAKPEPNPVPHIPKESVLEMFQRPQQAPRSSGGTRRDIAFDRNHLIAQVEDLWHDWFLEPGEAPRPVIEGIVDSFIREARAFWQGKGGQMDFDTYVRTKLREQPRWKQIYGKKLPSQSEEEFVASFQRPIAQLGQTAEFTRSQTEAAVTSGGSPTEQLRRVMQTREVQQSGGFSRRLAETLRGIGVG